MNDCASSIFEPLAMIPILARYRVFDLATSVVRVKFVRLPPAQRFPYCE